MATINNITTAIQSSPAFGTLTNSYTEEGKKQRKMLKRTLTVFQNFSEEAGVLRRLSDNVLFTQVAMMGAQLDYDATAHLVSSVDDVVARNRGKADAEAAHTEAVARLAERRAIAVQIFGEDLVSMACPA